MSETASFEVPGTPHRLWYERTESGRLLRLWSGDCVYVADDGEGLRTYGDNLAVVREMSLSRGLLRHVEACGESWIEEYSWDEAGRPVLVDGVRIERDERHRVIVCHGGETWRYGYASDHLAVIDRPRSTRYLTRGDSGRPVIVRERDRVDRIEYDDDGIRLGVSPLPPGWHRDPFGRLRTISASDGTILHTWLWDGFACIGRIDGEPGQPLAACFSLDPSYTPVRVITNDGVTRIPRDAFGEALLAHRGVPGLYGGAIHEGFVHLRSRAIDPRCGSFDQLDPFHGREDDPRRDEGYDGPLLIETAASGPYAVSQYDPVGRVDATGEIDVGSIFLDPTWALQNNLAGWFGLDWSIGWWLDWVVSFGQIFAYMAGNRDEAWIKRFFDYEGLMNERTGHWGIRRGFFNNPRAFTFQHIVVANHESFEDLQQSNVIDPKGLFAPTLYGTMLRCVPVGGTTFLLRGNGDATLVQWTRHGGPAVAVSPGSPVPRFPSGGFHLAQTRPDLGPLPCSLTELVPSGVPVTANAAATEIVAIVPSPTPLVAGAIVVLTDSGRNADIKTVLDVKPGPTGNTATVRFTEPGTTVASTNVTLQPLKTPPANEPGPVSAVAAVPGRLSTAGTTLNYAANDALKLSQGGTVVGSILVQGFETAITLDAALPSAPPMVAPVKVFTAIAGPTVNGDTLAGNVLTTAGVPPNGSIMLTGNGLTVGAQATPSGPNTATLDRSPSVGAGPQWATLSAAPLTPIGNAPAIGATTTLTYNPVAIRTAPGAGSFVILTDSSATPVTTARAVTALQYDAIVSASSTLPPNVAVPYQIADFTPAGGSITNLTLSTQIGVTIAAAAPIIGASLQIFTLPSAALTAGASTLVNAGGSVVGPVMNVTPAQAATFAPSQMVIIGNGTALETNVVLRLTATVTLDRAIAFATGAVIDAVPLAAVGTVWNATFVSANTVTVQPTAGAGPVFVQMPRFEVGGFVLVTPAAGPALQFRIFAVAGSTLTLTEGPPVPNAVLTVQLLVPVAPAPANDTWRIGLRGATSGGAVVGGVTQTNTVTIDIWNTLHWAAGKLIALIEVNPAGIGTAPHIAIVLNTTYSVTFVTPPTINANLTVTTVTSTPFYAGTFTQSGADLTLSNTVGTAPSGTNLLIVVPFAPAAVPIIAPAGQLSPGTVLVPVEPENWDIDRKKSLTFHELTHTRQAMHSGPLFWGYIPLFALEGLLEWKTDVGMPEWSKYISGTISQVNAAFVLEASDAASIDLAEGSKVQLEMSGASGMATLGKPDGGKFPLIGSIQFAAGAVQLRRNSSTASAILNGFLDAFQILTLGGLCNIGAALTWGGVIRLFGNLANTISHRLFHTGTEYKATVTDTTHITMSDDDGRRSVQGFRRVFLKAADITELYDIDSIDDAKITLKKATPFTGDIGVKPYDGADLIDGLDYWDATVPDKTKPSQIKVAQRNGKSMDLKAFDRVSIAAGKFTNRMNVTAADGDVVDLDRTLVTFGSGNDVRVAKVDELDPIGGADSRLLVEMGVGWMRWLFDPYGQIQYRVAPTNKFANAAARIARYAFGNHSWSGILLGRLFVDDMWHQILDKDSQGQKSGGILSPMEQEAAEESGNLYSVLSKMHGNFTVPDDSKPSQLTANVGDIGRYWHSPNWFTGTTVGPLGSLCQPLSPSLVVTSPGTPPVGGPAGGTPLFDAPGLTFLNQIDVVPAIGTEAPGGAAATLNAGAATTSARPGTFVPDMFYPKATAAADPEATFTANAGGGTPTGYRAGARGLIPVSPTVELSLGAYVAFNQPGKHRVTMDDGIPGWPSSRAAHDANKQTILFDVTVSDITVILGGQIIPQATPPPTVTLIPTQIVRLSTTSGGTFALTPTAGVVVTVNGASLQATSVLNSEFVEISRFYNVSGTPPTFVDGVLSLHGVNLPVAIHVPVRLIQVTVVNKLTLTSAAASTSAVAASVKPGGTAFAFVPANIVSPLVKQTVTYGAGTPLIDPSPVVGTVGAGSLGDLAALQDGGTVFQITFPANDPPESAATITFGTVVGTAVNQNALTASIILNPHFTLSAASLQVSRGGANPVLVLNAGAINVTAPLVRSGDATGIAFTPPPNGPNLSITVTPATPLGKRQILVTDAADATHLAAITIEVVA